MIRRCLALVCTLALTPVASAAEMDLTGFTVSQVTFSGGPRVLLADNDLVLGLGGQVGYTLPVGVYFGGLTDFFLASSQQTGGGIRVSGSWQALHLLGVGGFDFGFGDSFVLRPTVGFGLVNVSARACADVGFVGSVCESDGRTEVGVTTGGQALYRLSRFTIGGEARLIVGPVDGVWIGFNAGFAFGPE